MTGRRTPRHANWVKMRRYIEVSVFIVGIIGVAACNATDQERFSSQQSYVQISQTTSTLTAHGATYVKTDTERFRCPTISGISSSNDVTVFSVQANAPTPHFTLESSFGIRGDTTGGFAVSMSEFPIGLLDIYMRCNSSPSDRYVTSCPERYEIVESCEAENAAGAECVKLYEGTHRLVVSAEISEDATCFTEEVDRSPYSVTVPDVAMACDAFSPIELAAAYRGDAPIELCCSKDQKTTLDFCLKPCGCRKLIAKIVPKQGYVEQDLGSRKLNVAVFSKVLGNKKSFEKLVESIRSHGVDVIVSLGDLTGSGKLSEFRWFRDRLDSAFVYRDGQDAGNDACTTDEAGNICCQSTGDRLLTTLCNAVFAKTPFIAGLGAHELQEDLSSFNSTLGVSNMSTVVGNVQIVMLDTVDALISAPTQDWLKRVLKNVESPDCEVPQPREGGSWPTLAECRERLSGAFLPGEAITCRACIGEEAYCVVPDAATSDPTHGPENCVCVPITSQICRNNQTCRMTDATHGVCTCTRDEDCGIGGSCVDGACEPPLRLVMTYTPPFDKHGTRNNAFTSKTQAVSLMSLLAQSGVAAIFSGKSADYGKFSMAGIPIYITGGGGAPMEAFSDYGHHWLKVEIDNAYAHPTRDDIRVTVVEF